MNDLSQAGVAAAAVTVLGFAWQWCRAPKHINNAWSWGGFIALACLLYIWATPAFAHDWRISLLGAYMMVQSARGSAATFKDLGAAPATNSL